MGLEHHAGNLTVHCTESMSLGYYHWINFVLISMIAFVGLFSQSVVIIVLARIKKKTSTDIFLLALSILDILVIVTISVTENSSIYMHILRPGQQILNAGYIAVIAHPFEHIAHFGSTWCIVLMSLDRYISICHTNRARYWCTAKKAKIQIVILIIVDVIYSSPRFVEYYGILGDLDHLIGKCNAEVHDFPEDTIGENPVYIWMYTFCGYLIVYYLVPLALLCYFNYHLIKIIKDRINFHKKRNEQRVSPNSTKKPPRISQYDVSSTDMQEGIPSQYLKAPQIITPDQSSTKIEVLSSQQNSPTVINDQPALSPEFVHPSDKVNQMTETENEVVTPVETNANSCNGLSRNFNNNIGSYRLKLQPSLSVASRFSFSRQASNSVAYVTKEKSHSRYIQRQYDHVIRMLITVTIIFSICQIPDMIQQLISRISTWEFSEEFGIIAYDFIIINSSVNFFIYTATSQRFKKKLVMTFKFLRKRKVGPMNLGSTTDRT